MNILCLADLHGHLPVDIPSQHADVVVIAGDVCRDYSGYTRYENADIQLRWLRTQFHDWVVRVVRRPVIMTWGNHDFVAEAFSREEIEHALDLRREDAVMQWDPHVVILTDGECAVYRDRYEDRTVRFAGTPWSTLFGSWAFMREDHDLDEKYAQIPEHVDVLLAHGPPYGYGCRTRDGRATGSRSLVRHLHRVQPRYVVCGHIHEARGTYPFSDTTVINAAYLNESYRPHVEDEYNPKYRIINV